MDFSCKDDRSQLFARFLTESDFSRPSRMTFRAALRTFSSWCTGHNINTPDTASLIQWKSFLIDRYQTATARTYLTIVKAFFRWLSRRGLWKDIGTDVRNIKVEHGFRKDCLSAAEIKRILTWLKNRLKDGDEPALRNFMVVLVIVTCGLRVAEVSRLDVGDLDSVAGEPVLWVYGKARYGKADYIAITPGLRKLLTDFVEKRPGISRTSPIFISYGRNSYGKRLSPRSISRIAKQAMVSAGFNSPRLTAHSLRHTALTLALEAGASLQQVQQFARHRQVGTTLYYAHNLELSRNPCSRLIMGMIGEDSTGIPEQVNDCVLPDCCLPDFSAYLASSFPKQ